MPLTAATLLAALLLYAAGTGRAWRRAGVGRGVGAGEAMRFWAGWAVLSVALLSPLEELSGRSLSAHMVQHLLLIVVAAPLLASGGAGRAVLNAFPRRLVVRAGPFVHRLAPARRLLDTPLLGAAAYAGLIWVWHAPALYQAAVAVPIVHAAEHGSLLAAGWLFWAAVLPGAGKARRRPGAVAALLAASFATGALGAFMTLAPAPWYPAYAAVAAATGRDALADQQLAGLLMWMPMGAVHAAAALVVAAGWLRGGPSRSPARALRAKGAGA